MKLLIMLTLLGRMVSAQYVAPTAVAPVNDGQVSIMHYQDTDIWYAHSHLAGRYFYDQQVGSTITVIDGGEITRYKVVAIHHILDTNWAWHDFDPYVGSDLLLFTCWDGGAGRGYGQAIGRMIIQLEEVYDEEQARQQGSVRAWSHPIPR
jgi:hypothetical protein